MGVFDTISKAVIGLGVIVWDNGLFLLNLVTPNLKEGEVVPHGALGHNLTWPEYHPPKEGDSRSACPVLNAMANHGILPHDGKNISFTECTKRVQQTCNFAPSFCFFAPKFAADFLGRSYWKDTFNLDELNLRASDAIEHDASLTRRDLSEQPDQSKPDHELINRLLEEATAEMPDGSPRLSKEDLIRAMSKRRAEARKLNEKYSDSLLHRMFGCANSCTMLTIFGGSVSDLTPMLRDERFSEHWEPRIRSRHGLTMAQFNSTVLTVEWGIDPKKYQ